MLKIVLRGFKIIYSIIFFETVELMTAKGILFATVILFVHNHC